MAEDKATTAKKSTPTKKSSATKKATSTRQSASTKKATSTRQSASTKKAAPTKKSTTRSSRPSAKATSGRDSSSSGPASAAEIAVLAAGQLIELTGRGAEGVTGVERTDDGWRVHVEVVELRRIPETTDLLATYEVTMSDDGAMTGYRRIRRYARGSTEGG